MLDDQKLKQGDSKNNRESIGIAISKTIIIIYFDIILQTDLSIIYLFQILTISTSKYIIYFILYGLDMLKTI